MNVLCVMAHPDDEVLGCGGTLAKHAENGDNIRLFILAERDLGKQIQEAAHTLGIKWTCSSALPDQAFELLLLRDIIAELPRNPPAGGWLLGDHNPDIIYTHHPGDLNTDHAIVAKAVLTAFRPKPGEKPRTILACEVLSSTEWTFPQQFQPNWFEQISIGQLYKKSDALKCYESEIRDAPHPRNEGGVWNQAAYRGRQSGVEFAEAFQLLRRGPM